MGNSESSFSSDKKKLAKNIWDNHNTLLIFIVLIVSASFASEHFLTGNNISNLVRQIAVLGISSMGMFMVIVTGGIDLSVGSMTALGCVLVAGVINSTGSIPLAIATVMLVGLVLGAISGLFITLRGVQPFVMTLAMMTIARGLAYMYSNGNPIMFEDMRFFSFIQYKIVGIPIPAILLLVIVAITIFLFKKTYVGRTMYAIGSNEEAVRLSGIRVKTHKFLTYTLSGLLSASAGMIVAGRTGVGSPLVGVGLELDAIAACVIGGVSLAGGKGRVFYALLGVIILGVISNLLNLMNVPSYPQQVIKGIIIVGAVVFQKSK